MKTWVNINGFFCQIWYVHLYCRDLVWGCKWANFVNFRQLSACHMSVFLFLDDNLSKYQWLFTKFGMCIDIVKIWFGLADGQSLSVFYSYLPATRLWWGIIVSRFYLKWRQVFWLPVCFHVHQAPPEKWSTLKGNSLLRKEVYSKTKELAPKGSKSFIFRVDPLNLLPPLKVYQFLLMMVNFALQCSQNITWIRNNDNIICK